MVLASHHYGADEGNWAHHYGQMEAGEGLSGCQHKGFIEALSPLFNFNPESLGSIDTSLPGYSFTRATTATTISRSGSVYTIESVATGTPRYVDHPTLGAGYWCESAATNICLQSEDFSTTWSASNVTVNANEATAPDGTSTADGFEATSGSARRVEQTISTTAQTYTFSVWLKNHTGANDWALVQLSGLGGTWVNVATGALGATSGTIINRSITSYGNGWHRVTVTDTGGASSTLVQVWPVNGDSSTSADAAGGSSDFHVWGAQLEAQSFASSYIPTTTTSVTRNADDLRYEHSLSSGAAGSLVIAVTRSDYTESGLAFLGHVGDTAAERIRVLLATTNRVSTTGSASSSTVWSLNSSNNSMVDGTRHVFALSWDTNDVEAFLDGASFGTDTSSSNPSMSNKVFIGAERTGINQFGGVVHLMKLYDVTGIDGSAET